MANISGRGFPGPEIPKIDNGVDLDTASNTSVTRSRWRRSLPRFSLAVLLVLLVGISVAFAWISNLRFEQQIVAKLERKSKQLKVFYDYQLDDQGKFNGRVTGPASPLMKRWFGEHVGAKVEFLHIVGGQERQSVLFL